MDKNKLYPPDWQQAGSSPPKPEDFNAEGDLIVMDDGKAFVFKDATEFIEEIIEENRWWCKAPDKARFRQSNEETDYDIATPEEMKVTTTDKEIALPNKKDPVLLEDEIKRLEAKEEPTGLIVPVLSDLGKAYKLLEKREKIIGNLQDEIKELRSVVFEAGKSAGKCEKCVSLKEDVETMKALRNDERRRYAETMNRLEEKDIEYDQDIQLLKKALHVVTK